MTRVLRLFAWGGLAIGIVLTVTTWTMMQPDMPARATIWGLAMLAGARSLVLGVAWWLVFMTLAYLRDEADASRARLERILRNAGHGGT